MLTPQHLLDALDHLDDDLIAETDALRSNSGTRKRHWIRWLSAAACLGVVLLSVWVYRSIPPAPSEETAQPTNAVSGSPSDAIAAGPLEGVDGASPRCITATILKWKEDSFTASVVTSNDSIVKKNQQVDIIFVDDTTIPRDALPIGSTVTVFFSDLTEDPQSHRFTLYAEELLPMIEEEN